MLLTVCLGGGIHRTLPAGESPPLESAAALRAAGRFDEALGILRTASRAIRQAEGENAAGLLPINDLAAEILIDQGSLENARALLEKTIAIRERRRAAGEQAAVAGLADSWLSVARLEKSARKLPDAVAATRRALLLLAESPDQSRENLARVGSLLETTVAELEAMLGPTDEATREARGRAAETFVSLGMLPAAVGQCRSLLESLEARADTSTDRLLQASAKLSNAALWAGRADEAIPDQTRVVQRLAAGDAGEAAVESARRLLGELHLAAEQFILAQESFPQPRSAKAGGPVASGEIGNRLHRLLIAARQGAERSAPDWLQDDLAALAKAAPTERPAAISGCLAAADVLAEFGDLPAAVPTLKIALAFAKSQLPPDPTVVAEVTGRLARALLAGGDLAGARKLLDAELPAARKSLGTRDPRVVALRIPLAELAFREADVKQATRIAREILATGLIRPDAAWENAAIQVYDRLAETDAGADLRQAFLAARAEQFGADHPHTGMANALFGTARLAAGDWPQAVAFFEKALAIQRAARGERHPETAACLLLLGHAQRSAGKAADAVATLERSVATWELLVGPDHAGTLEAVEALALARLADGRRQAAGTSFARLCEADAANPRADPARVADHLVRLADLTAADDDKQARRLLEKAMQSPCWNSGRDATEAGRQRLALTAAVAARAFASIGDREQSEQALRQARSLALSLPDPKPTLDELERVARGGRRGADNR